jgi:hypothetical protein
MKLLENLEGTGDLQYQGERLATVRYRLRRYQGMTEGSAMPIPGLFRIEGAIDAPDLAGVVGKSLGLRLEDGRLLSIVLADAAGRVLSEGHGPSRCLCC